MALTKSKDFILQFIDFFHKPFARWIDQQTFRYLACGGTNVLLDFSIYVVCFFFVFQKEDITLSPSVTIGAMVASNIISFCFSFPIGFMLSRHVVFPESNLRGRVQLFRYAIIVAVCFVLNYIFIKAYSFLLALTLSSMLGEGAIAVISKIFTVVTVAVFSYIAQRNFTFKIKQDAKEEVSIEIEM
jgi:putative flippase GtrA